MPSNFPLWDRIRELTRSNRIYQQERLYSDQPGLASFTAGSDYDGTSGMQAILDSTNLNINRLERYRDYDRMDQTGEISLALDIYADEVSLTDPEYKHALIIRAKTKKIKEELEELFYKNLLIDRWIRPAARYLCKYGCAPHEIITDRSRTSVAALKPIDVFNFTRVETRNGDLVGFLFQDELYQNPTYMHPWSVMHPKLTTNERQFAPYGRAVIEGGRKAHRQLMLMEDAALIYRITRSPERRMFKIPVGMAPPKEVDEIMSAAARKFKRQRFYNPDTGQFDERYSPIVQEEDFFLPQRSDGTGPTIETLPGAENLDQIADIEYFKKKMVAPMRIPFSRVGIGEGAGQPNEKSLSQADSEFAKAVKWIQAEISLALTKVAIVHMALRGYPVEDLVNFELHLAATSALEDLYRMETWQTRTAVMGELKELGWFPKEWIVERFTNLSPDEMEDLKEQEEEESGGMGGGGGGGLPASLGDDLGEPPGGEMTGPDGQPMPDSGGGAEPGGEEDLEGNEFAPDGLNSPDDDLEIEGYDYEGERRLMAELGMFRRRQKLLREEEFIPRSPMYNYLRESCELDGLPSPDCDLKKLGGYGRNDKVLVEWSISKKLARTTLAEYKAALGCPETSQE